MSRVAMLDVFVTLFGVAAVYFLIVDRDTRRTGDGAPTPRETVAGGCGVMAGAAIAAKWSGILVLVGVLALTAIWDHQPAHRANRDARRRCAANGFR